MPGGRRRPRRRPACCAGTSRNRRRWSKTRWSLTRPRNARRNRRAYMATPIVVPGLGESVTEATVAKWMKNVGDPVKADEALAELETDKVTQELYAPTAGTLGEITAPAGSVVAIGAVIGQITDGRVAAPAPAKPAPAAAPHAAAPAPCRT